VAVEVYYLFILFIFQESIEENERHFIFIFITIWTCMNLNLFELYLKFMIVMYFIILFEFMIKYFFLNNFVNTHRYLWILTDMKKIYGYPHNGYPTDMGMGTG